MATPGKQVASGMGARGSERLIPAKQAPAVAGSARANARIQAGQKAQAPAPERATEQLPAYFYRLSAADQRRYLASDQVRSFPLEMTPGLAAKGAAVAAALVAEDLRATARAAQQLADALTAALGTRPVAVQVCAMRPRNRRGELHGIYYPRPYPPRIVVWARTARRHQPVAPKTFLRTLVHEVAHHLDYALLHLGASFHTYGFFQRESFLVRALWAAEDRKTKTLAQSYEGAQPAANRAVRRAKP